MSQPDVAVILPCFNEGQTIGRVVADFRASLPTAAIYVFDNASSDDTAAEARRAGAIVHSVRARGKGNVVRQAFAAVDADIYVLADGDGTYDASRAGELVALVMDEHLDMVVATRVHGEVTTAYRAGHVIGNRLFNGIIELLFAKAFADIFSGYRALSRPFVKSFPALATGFETETEMSLHAIQLGLPTMDVPTRYGARVEGSDSKLDTWRDGARILMFILRLLLRIRPLLLFATLAGLAAFMSLVLGLPIVITFIRTGLVPRFPTAVAAASLGTIAVLSLVTGLILDSVAYAQKVNKRLAYLSIARRASSQAAG